MNTPTILTGVLAILTASAVHAAPIGTISELQMSHSFVVNGGTVPARVEINSQAHSFDLDASATSMVDDPTAVPAQVSSFARSSRNTLFTNLTDQLLSVNTAGQFDAVLTVETTGDDGIGRVAGAFACGQAFVAHRDAALRRGGCSAGSEISHL